MKSNPLSTRFVAPGKLAWRPVSGLSLSELATRFTGPLQRRAAIVGGHGTGKTTLLESLVPLLGSIAAKLSTYEGADNGATTDISGRASNEAGAPATSPPRRIVWLKLRGRAPSRRLLFQTYRRWSCRDCILVLDGYEQLSPFARSAALILTKVNGAGILVTSHTNTALATLIHTQVDVALAQELMHDLLPEDHEHRDRVSNTTQVEELLRKHRGNLREVFMELYDLLEQS